MPVSPVMPVVRAGVPELRVKSVDGIFRVFHYLASPKGFSCFTQSVKKTQRTPLLEIE